MKQSYLVLTDSGGIQEEAPALGKPVLVMRCETERPEALDEGVVWMVGADFETIVDKTCLLLHSDEEYRRVARKVSPYGNGSAAEKIVKALLDIIF